MADDRRIIYLSIDASRAVDGSAAATRALAAIDKSTASTASALDRMEASLGRVGGYLKAQLALMLANVAGQFVTMAKESLAAAAGLDELAEQLGITATGLQALQFSAVQSGVKLEQLETGVSKFSQKMGEAAGGSKEMIEALDRIGVKVLDTNGKLRPTEDLLQNVAAAILKIDDPAKRAAAAVDFFGKAGTRMLPMLADMAKGFDSMSDAAKRAGAMISADTIKKLDALGDSAERGGLQLRAMFAENAAGPLTAALDLITRAIENLRTIIGLAKGELSALLLLGQVNPFMALGAAVGSAFSSTPTEKLAADLKARQSDVDDMRLNLEAAQSERDKERMQAALDKANGELARVQRQLDVAKVAGKASYSPSDPDGVGITITKSGARNPLPTGAGKAAEDAQKKYDKLTVQLQETARAQEAMTDAARKGDVAFEEAKVHLDAVQKTLEIFGKRLADNDPLLVELEARMLRVSRTGIATAFNVATNELEKQNVILEAQIRLRNELPEVQAREIANIKVAQDAAKAGAALTDADKQRRLDAYDIGEKLKAQSAELQRANDLWTEPLKSALQDIQSTAADAFESMLESGKFNFEELGKVFKKIVIRMAAEWLALATVRPVMSVLVNAVSPGMARQFGLDSGTGSSGGLFGGGGFGDLFSGIGNSLSGAWDKTTNAFSSWFGGGATNINPNIGLAASRQGGYGASATSLGGIGGSGIGWGNALGAAAGFGMGAYQLMSGGGSTASTIGGISSMVGAAVSLIPGIGQIAGPLIALAGGLLPGLFETPKKPPKLMATGGLNFNAGKWNYAGSEYNGGSGLGGALGGIGSTMQSLMDSAGVTSLTSSHSLNYQTMSQGDFSNATTFVDGVQWGQGSTDADIGLDTAAAHIAHKIMMEVDSGISDLMRQGLGNFDQKDRDSPFSTDELGVAVTELKAFDDAMKDLGKTTTTAEAALKAIDDKFKVMLDTAEKYELDAAPVEAQKTKERMKVATDFADALQRDLDDMVNPNKGLLADLEKEKQAAIDINKYIVENVTDSLDQINKIEELYGKKRADIVQAAAIDAWSTVPALARGQYLFGQGQLLNADLRAMNDDARAIGGNPTATALRGYASDRDLFIKGVGDTFGVGSTEYLDATIAAYGLFNAQFKAANDDFVETLNDALLDPFELQVETLKRERDAAMETARSLDASGKLVEEASLAFLKPIEKLAVDLKQSIGDQILETKDPLAYTIRELERQRDKDLKDARLLNETLGETYMPTKLAIDARYQEGAANYAGVIDPATGLLDKSGFRLDAADQDFLNRMETNYVNLLEIEELYLEKKLKAEKDYYAASLAGIEELIDRVTFGDLSGASAVTVFNEQQKEYADVRSRAFSGDQAGLDEFGAVAGDYLEAAKGYFAFTPEYFALLEQIKRDAEELDQTISAGKTPSGGGQVSTDVAALMDRLDRAQAANDDKQRQIDKMLTEQAYTNSLLARLVANGR